MDISLGSLGFTGLNLDINPADLPPQIFNRGLNVEFKGSHIEPMVQEIVRATHPQPGSPIYLLESFFVAGNVLCWLACTETKAFVLYMGVWTDVTPADFLPSTKYQTAKINGFILLNNGRQKPYYVDIHNPLTKLLSYSVWPDNLLCEVITSIEGILVGCGVINSSGIFNKQLVIWSDIADPGFLPTNFNFSDPASRAGFTTLEGDEFAVAAVYLENRIQLYRSLSIYDISFVGGNSVLAFSRRQLQPNLLSRNAVAAFRRSHFGIGDGYFFEYNGFDITPLGKDIVSDYFFSKVNQSMLELVTVVYDSALDQIVIAYPEGTATACNRALLFDMQKKIWKHRELDLVTAIGLGHFPEDSDLVAWEDLTTSWADWTDTWLITYTKSEKSNLVLSSPGGLYKIPTSGLPKEISAQRLYIAFDSKDQSGTPDVNRHLRKLFTECWPEVYGTVRYRFGYAENTQDVFAWTGWELFNGDFQQKTSHAFAGKYVAIELSNNINGQLTNFRFGGFALTAKPRGRY